MSVRTALRVAPAQEEEDSPWVQGCWEALGGRGMGICPGRVVLRERRTSTCNFLVGLWEKMYEYLMCPYSM